jgi:hypothetical protein
MRQVLSASEQRRHKQQRPAYTCQLGAARIAVPCEDARLGCVWNELAVPIDISYDSIHPLW